MLVSQMQFCTMYLCKMFLLGKTGWKLLGPLHITSYKCVWTYNFLQIKSLKNKYHSVVSNSLQPCGLLSTPSFLALHYFPEFTQTHVHWVGDAIQPSHPLSSPLLPPSIIPSIRVFSNESVLRIRWPKDWSFSFNISPSNEFQDWFPLGWTGWISLQSKGLSRVFSNTTVQIHIFFCTQLSLWYNSHIHTWLLEKP